MYHQRTLYTITGYDRQAGETQDRRMGGGTGEWAGTVKIDHFENMMLTTALLFSWPCL